MSSPTLLALKTELEAALAVLLPQIEGLHDFASLDLQDPTKADVQSATVDFERRRDLINTALAGLNGLITDNYPEVAQRNVVEAIYEDLKDNVETITAAFAKFTPIAEAASVTLTPGVPELKP